MRSALAKSDFLYDAHVGVNAIGSAIGNSIVADMRESRSREEAFAEMANQNQERYVDEPGISHLPGYEGSPGALNRDPRVGRSLLNRPMIDDQGRVIRGGELPPLDAEGMEAIPVMGQGTPGMEQGPGVRGNTLNPFGRSNTTDISGGRSIFDDYDSLNTMSAMTDAYANLGVGLEGGPRSLLIDTALQSHTELLQYMGDLYGMRPDAIAAAIKWEFTENWRGYTSDQIFSNGTPFNRETGLPDRWDGDVVNDGYGFGQTHYTTLQEPGMFPSISVDMANALRNDLPSMIAVTGMRMAEHRDIYRNITSNAYPGGIDLSDNAPGLAVLYNSSQAFVTRSAEGAARALAVGQVPTLRFENNMADWVYNNPQSFGWLKPINPIVVHSAPFNFTVSPTKK